MLKYPALKYAEISTNSSSGFKEGRLHIHLEPKDRANQIAS